MPDLGNRAAFVTMCLWMLKSGVLGSCRFPHFLLKPDPWIGDYKDGKVVAYVKPTLISLNEQNIKISRECLQRVADKYLIGHREENQGIKYLCMQFLQRGDYIVQIKSQPGKVRTIHILSTGSVSVTSWIRWMKPCPFDILRSSHLFLRQSVDICDESGMTIEPYPLVYSGQTPDSSITCPFTGGYNIYAYYAHPNNSLVCNNLLLLMRMESECDRGEGIMFNFRREECIPRELPDQLLQRAHCVAHWTQDNYTFIILQHAEVHTKWFCLRTADPLNDIKNAYLWLKVICDTSDKPSAEVSQSYLRLVLTKQTFSSTCADELELCQEMIHYCNMPYSGHCAHTCGLCMSENQIGVCTFQEQYRGTWIESSSLGDVSFNIDAYSLHIDSQGKYDCLNLDSDKLKDKRVLLELYGNGCLPRYACVEMSKVTSSVMKFRLGNRLTWPLSSLKNQKEEVCKVEHFKAREHHGSKSAKERPAKLLVNTGNIREVPCSLPSRLQNGIAFREDGKHCGGCLNYEPEISPNHFTISPVNCSTETSEYKGYRNIPIQYSCLATFEFHNDTYSVVTRTLNFVKGMGQYLVWIFTPDNHIKVLKSADTFIYEHTATPKSDLIQAQFSILRSDNLQCRNFFFLPRSTTPTTTTHQHWYNPGAKFNQESIKGVHWDKNDNHITGPTVNGDDYVPYSQNSKDDSQVNVPNVNKPRFDNSNMENISDQNTSGGCRFAYANVSLCKLAVTIFLACYFETHPVT